DLLDGHFHVAVEDLVDLVGPVAVVVEGHALDVLLAADLVGDHRPVRHHLLVLAAALLLLFRPVILLLVAAASLLHVVPLLPVASLLAVVPLLPLASLLLVFFVAS